jgi:hypothetical protein
MSSVRVPPASEAELFLRLWDQNALPPTVARHILKMSWSAADELRMSELAVKNREGELTPPERDELDTYVRVGLTLSVLQSRARKRLNHATTRPARG